MREWELFSFLKEFQLVNHSNPVGKMVCRQLRRGFAVRGRVPCKSLIPLIPLGRAPTECLAANARFAPAAINCGLIRKCVQMLCVDRASMHSPQPSLQRRDGSTDPRRQFGSPLRALLRQVTLRLRRLVCEGKSPSKPQVGMELLNSIVVRDEGMRAGIRCSEDPWPGSLDRR